MLKELKQSFVTGGMKVMARVSQGQTGGRVGQGLIMESLRGHSKELGLFS